MAAFLRATLLQKNSRESFDFIRMGTYNINIRGIFTKGKADKKALFVNCTDDREMKYFSETDSSSVL